MKLSTTMLLIGLGWSQIGAAASASDALAEYCLAKGGTLTPMTAWFETEKGSVEGFTEQFCTFERDRGHIVIGLSAFAAEQPNIAATYMKNLPEITEKSTLMAGGAGNPSYNVCKNLGGTAIGFKFPGTFKPKDGGDSDVCVFGDGSMVSAWSLIYMANHRAGYDEIKGYVKSEPLAIPMGAILSVSQ